MPKYLTLHHETSVDKVTLESRWTEIAQDLRAEWKVTLYNLAQGRRFCEWDASNKEVVEEILGKLGIKWTEILEVETTVPSEWRLWELESGRELAQSV